MSAITGFINRNNSQKIIEVMLEEIKHRGNDQKEIYTDNFIALGSSILDIDNDLCLYKTKEYLAIGDIRIFAYHELQNELGASSVLELFVKGYQKYNSEIFNKVNGSFAIIIYDLKNNKVIGARDIWGIKPLYYYLQDDKFIWASEIKAILKHPDCQKEINEQMIPAALTFEYVPNEETIFNNIFKLRQGTYFVYENNELKIEKYHEFSFENDKTKKLDDWSSLISEKLGSVVEEYIDSKKEVGSLLSSGVDSSYVAYKLSKKQKAKTFSLGYVDESVSELNDAREFAKDMAFDFYEKKVATDDFFAILPKVLYHMDEPLANPSALALYFINEETKKHLDIILSGEGADEIFGGYSAYQEVYTYEKYQKIPLFIRKIIGSIAGILPAFRGKRFFVRGALKLEEKYGRCNFAFSDHEVKKLLKYDYHNYRALDLTKRHFHEYHNDNYIEMMQYVDYHTWLPDDILLKIDKMSAAHGLEVRFPYLDQRMLAITSKMPSHYKATKSEVKVALRYAAAKEIDEKVAYRTKLGMPSPLASWMRQDKYYNLIKEKFNSDTAKKFFKINVIMDLLDKHKSGKVSNMQKIWSIYTFLVWYEVYFS